MARRDPRWRRILVVVYVGVLVGGTVGAWLGNASHLGYNVLFGPWGPQANVDPQPSGWVGWWIAGGTAVGAALGLAAALLLLAAWRLVGGATSKTT